ncbi:sulfide/dihydroorotate dehydrogenase-like FAD/NAD-binding protein [uncultured Rikenella sp.]|uniref:sulfide/dihydroorotate dehydrogenase-like FAD/NAD-binding protein n=1 Tax=uncultured Rikenella sp. TaxID=368003 RepID=UPI00272D11B3|nr:sulfide/dihydroorotate dehydrogenase-like FAD/NAD-binding protein [uncultured Rikenella sp.]
MFRILKKRLLAPAIYLMEVEAPRVARAALPGQFLIVIVDEKGERIPLTICDYDAERGTVTIVIQAIGASTMRIVTLEEGDSFADFVGPLGHPSEFIHYSPKKLAATKFLFVAGGLGAAPVYPQVKWLAERDIQADVIIGAKNESLVLLEEEFRALTPNVHIATDDGSKGYKGLVTNLLKELVVNDGKHFDCVVAIGPMIMMKFVALTTKELHIPTIVSLNTLMVDGTGMCGACRVTVGGKTRFACVEGPEFDAHQVDFDEAMRRQGMYRTIEERKKAIEAERAAGHKCNIGL